MPSELLATGVAPLRPGVLLAVRLGSVTPENRWLQRLEELSNTDLRIILLHEGVAHANELPWVEEAIAISSAHTAEPRRLSSALHEILRLHEVRAILLSTDTPPSRQEVAARIARARGLLTFGDDAHGALEIAEALRARETSEVPHGRRIAFVGTRGVPSRYSGFETFVEQLGARLVERGDEVTVYTRPRPGEPRRDQFRGMKIKNLPAPKSKHLETIVHTFISMVHALFVRYDAVIVCGVGNAPFFWIPRLRGARVVCNVDGSDWKRGKWGAFAKCYLRWCEALAARTADVLVADAESVRDQYLQDYDRVSRYVAYGSERPSAQGHDILDKFGLEPDGYVLFVGRLVPENGAHRLIEAHEKCGTDVPLVIVGDATYEEDYKAELRALAGNKVIFTGYQFEDAYHQLSANARLYVLASSVGGTHPVLIEQMAFGNPILAHNTGANSEVVGDAGVIYSGEEPIEDLARQMKRVLEDDDLRRDLGERAHARAHRRYSWESVVEVYSRLLSLPSAREARRRRARGVGLSAPTGSLRT